MLRTTRYAACILSLILCVGLLLKGSVPQVLSGMWDSAGSMTEPRAGASAVLLQDGRVLITGGEDATGPLVSADLFNTGASFAVAAAPMDVPRSQHISLVLQDGSVLVAGGTTTGGGATNAAELYNPSSNSWSTIGGGMTEARSGHTASLLKDGKVLISGGQSSGVASSTLEVFNPTTNSFEFVGALSSVRKDHAAAVLLDGRVLIAGGSDGNGALASVDIYDPETGSLSQASNLSTPRTGLSATTLLDGKVLLVGGNNGSEDLASAELYNTTTGAISLVATNMAVPRRDHLAFLLPHNNSVLIVGGTSAGAELSSAELFIPWAGNFNSTGSPLAARAQATGSPLSFDGLLLLAGGENASGKLSSAELYGFATVKTDKEDYAPGETVTITGRGWQPGETVTLTLLESPNLDTHGPFSAVADNTGNIYNIQFVPDEHDANILFYVTATGSVSQAQTTFTDSVTSVTITSPTNASPITVTSLPANVTISFSYVTSTTGSTTGQADILAAPTLSNTKNLTPGTGSDSIVVAIPAGTANGSYNVKVTVTNSTGSGANNKNDNQNAAVVVNVPAIASTTLSVASASGTYGGTTTLSATLMKTSDNSPISGKAISFTLNGNPAGSATTNGSGIATLSGVSLAGINANTYPAGVGATFAGDSGFAASSGSNTLTVSQATQTIAFGALSNKTYGDTPFTVSATGGASGNPVTFTAGPAGVCTSGGTNGSTITITGAGSCTVTAHQAGNSNYSAATDVPQSFTVNKATPTVAVSFAASPITYDGNPHLATATVTGVSGALPVPANGTVTISYKKGGLAFVGTPTDAASYTASAHFTSSNPNYNDADSTVDASLTINKATPTVAVSFAASPISYDGNPHPATPTVTGVSGALPVPANGTVTISYKKGGLAFAGTPTDAASYTASAHFASSNPNYNDGDSTADALLTIDKATPTVAVSFAASPIAYDGDAHPATATVTGVSGALAVPANGTVTISYKKGGLAFVGTPTDAASYTASAHFASSNPNYNNADSIADASLTIEKADPVVTATGGIFTYDGNPHSGSATATGVKGENLAPVTVAYSLSPGPGNLLTSAPVNAGTYSVAARYAGNDNYNQKQSTVASLTINKADSATVVTVAGGETFTYDGNPHPATVSVTGAGGLNESPAPVYSCGHVPTNVADSSCTASYSYAGDPNHNGSLDSKTYTISKADPVVTATGGIFTYDGNPHGGSATATGVKGENLTPVTVAYSLSPGPGNLLTSAPVNAGTYSVAARYAGNDNYNQKQSTAASLTINKADSSTVVTVVGGETFTYDGNPHSATVSVTGAGRLNESPAPVYSCGHAPIDVVDSGCTASYNFLGDDNHKPSSDTKTYAISKADPTVTATGGIFTYDGNPHGGSATATGVKGENLTPVTVAYSLSPGPGNLLTSAPVNAGTYSVAARYAGNDNYNQKQSLAAALTINKATPVFSGLSSPEIPAGTSPTTLSGNVSAGSLIPPGSVSIILNGVTQSAAINGSTGGFSASFATDTLGIGSYPITYTYPEETNFFGANGSGTLKAINVPPTVAANTSSVTVNEGTAAVNAGTFSDLNPHDNVSISASVGLVTQTGTNNGTWNWSFPTTDGPAQNQMVTITANDGNGGTTTTTFALAVVNVAPIAVFNAPTPVNEGSSSNLFLTGVSDPSWADTTSGYTYAFDCGDGSPYAFTPSATASCSAQDNGVRTVKGKVMDKDGGYTEYIATVTVNNVAPTITSVTGPTGPIALGSSATLTANFTDPGSLDTHTCKFLWDDSTDTSLSAAGFGNGSCTATHPYAAAGIYTVTVTVTDNDGGSAISKFEFVVIYDPTGGFVTGGGWINSPAGAYMANPSLTGKANFGFVSKYQKGSNVPTGETEFQFQVANLNFHSEIYQWLVVSGPKAQYKGTGTINGKGNYGFLLTATDGGINGGGGVDKFRIKIWDINNGGAIVYDTVYGASDDIDSANPLAISGGSIVIHK